MRLWAYTQVGRSSRINYLDRRLSSGIAFTVAPGDRFGHQLSTGRFTHLPQIVNIIEDLFVPSPRPVFHIIKRAHFALHFQFNFLVQNLKRNCIERCFSNQTHSSHTQCNWLCWNGARNKTTHLKAPFFFNLRTQGHVKCPKIAQKIPSHFHLLVCVWCYQLSQLSNWHSTPIF